MTRLYICLNSRVHQAAQAIPCRAWLSLKLHLFILFSVSILSPLVWEGCRGVYGFPKYLAGLDPGPGQSNLCTS